MLPVTIEGDAGPRMPAAIETAAYFVAAEAMANAAKHAQATRASPAASADRTCWWSRYQTTAAAAPTPPAQACSACAAASRRSTAADDREPARPRDDVHAELPCEL